MNNLVRPTLTRRIVLVLLVSFLLSCAVVVGVMYLEFRHGQTLRAANFADWPVALQLRDALETVDDPAAARVIGAAIERVDNGMRQRAEVPLTVVMQIRDRQDQGMIYSSPLAAAVSLRAIPQRPTYQPVHGRTFEVFELDTPRWSVLWGRTVVTAPQFMGLVSGDLLHYVSIAFPFMLVPTWLAVSHGLRPLRRLSQTIAARGPATLAPVEVEVRHAELKPLVTALDDLLARLRYKVESEQLFVANAAHELRTPLAVITAQAHALVKADTTAEQIEAESRLNSAIERASHLVHQLLAVARLQMERPAELSAVDLTLLTQKELANFVPAALERNIDVSLSAPDKLLFVLEVHTFRSILQNLIDNAIRYGREGGNVVVELQLRGETLVLCVADDGPGISESERERVFERFFRGSQRNDARGSGLGLTIAKQAATRLNGEIMLCRGLGGSGCSFVVEIQQR